MAGDQWQTLSVRELVDSGALAINDGYRVRNVELGTVGTPFLRGGDIGGGGVDTNVIDHVRPEFSTRIESKLTQPFDVAFISKGTVGRVGMLRPGQPQAVFSPQVCYWRALDVEVLDSRFLFYLLNSREFQSNLDAVKTSGAMAADYVSLADQKGFYVTLPPIVDQRRIAHILGSFDDKIELNRRMNATLEAMAQAIFKSWFVDFDPVRAKAEAAGGDSAAMERAAMAVIAGKTEEELDPLSAAQRHSLAQTAALFPDSFQDSELGEIPEGWEWSTIGDETETVGGATPGTKSPEFWDNGEFHWVTPKDFSSLNSKVLLASSRKITKKGLQRVSSGLLPPGTVLMSSRAPVGYLALSKIETAINQGFIAMKCSGRLPAEYVLQWAETEMDKIKQAASGSTFPEISKKAFRPFRILVPASNILAAFTAQVAPIYDKVASNESESTTLAALRDTLLPELLSGRLSPELNIPDDE